MQVAANKGMMDFVRRRRWVRKRRRVAPAVSAEAARPSQSSSGAQAAALPSQPSSTSTPSIQALQTAAEKRAAEGFQTPLGILAAGECVPLPQGWSARGSQLQVVQLAVHHHHRVLMPHAHNGWHLLIRSKAPVSAMGCSDSNDLLQMRPVVGQDDGQSTTHSWSIGAYGGTHTMQLDAIADGNTRLISCPPTADQPESSGAVPCCCAVFVT